MNNKQDLSAPPPLRVAIPDGKGGYTYEEAEAFDLRKPRTPGILPIEVGTRRGVIDAPDDASLTQRPGKRS